MSNDDAFDMPEVTTKNTKAEIFDAFKKVADEYEALREAHDEVLDELLELRKSGQFEPSDRQKMLMELGRMAMHYVKLDNAARFHDDVVEVERIRGVLDSMTAEFDEMEAQAEEVEEELEEAEA